MENEKEEQFADLYAPETEPFVNSQLKAYLFQIAKWAKFISIIGFVFFFFQVVRILTFEPIENLFSPQIAGPIGIARIFRGNYFFYILLRAALIFLPSLYLYQFSTKTKFALSHGGEEDLIIAFSKLKSFFKFCGILIIVFLILFALIFTNYIAKQIGLF